MAVRKAFSIGAVFNWIALEQYFTADAMGLGFEPTVPSPLGLCEGAIHSCVRRFKLPFFRLNLG